MNLKPLLLALGLAACTESAPEAAPPADPCASGDADACFTKAKALSDAGDKSAALESYRRACDAGSAPACTNAGWILSMEGTPLHDPASALPLLERGCLGKDAVGCANLANLLATGAPGVDPDAAESFKAAETGCSLGSAEACNSAALSLDRGAGVPKDASRARELFDKACAKDHLVACANLGISYEEQVPATDETRSRAVASYTKACEAAQTMDELLGCERLGMLHVTGNGVEKDFGKAMELWTKGCEGGRANSCLNVGILHRDGLGVDKSPEQWQIYRDKACTMGLAKACP